MSILTEIAKYMSDNSIGVYDPDSTSGTIFIDQLPEISGSFGLFGDEGGQDDDIKLGYINKPIILSYRGSTDPIESYDIIKSAYNLLKGFEGPLSSLYVVSIIPKGDPKSTGQDDSRNYVYRLRMNVEFLDS